MIDQSNRAGRSPIILHISWADSLDTHLLIFLFGNLAPHMYPSDAPGSCLGYMEGSQYAAYSRAAAAAAAGELTILHSGRLPDYDGLYDSFHL